MKKETFFIKIIIGVFKEMLSKIIATIIIVIFTLIKPKFMKSDININEIFNYSLWILLIVMCIWLIVLSMKKYFKKADIYNIINLAWIEIRANNPTPSGTNEQIHEYKLMKEMINELSSTKLSDVSRKDINKYVNEYLGNTKKNHNEFNNII